MKQALLLISFIIIILLFYPTYSKIKIQEGKEYNRYNCYEMLLDNYEMFKLNYKNCLLTPRSDFYLFETCMRADVDIFKEKIFTKTTFADGNYIKKCLE